MMSNTENWKHLLEEVEMMYFVFEDICVLVNV